MTRADMTSGLLVFATALTTLTAFGELRTFSDTTGRKIRGELIAISGDAVTIRRDDGGTFTVKISQFSAVDQEYIRQEGPNLVSNRSTESSVEKLTPKDFRVLPFSGTDKSRVLDPKAKGIFDELRVTTSERIRIHGEKEDDTGRLDGKVIYHAGKLALFPPGPRTGEITAKLPTQDDVRSYYAVLELKDKLNTAEMKIVSEDPHTWSVTEVGGTSVLTVKAGGMEIAKVTAPTADVKGVGFAATARWTGNKVDLVVTFDPPQK